MINENPLELWCISIFIWSFPFTLFLTAEKPETPPPLSRSAGSSLAHQMLSAGWAGSDCGCYSGKMHPLPSALSNQQSTCAPWPATNTGGDCKKPRRLSTSPRSAAVRSWIMELGSEASSILWLLASSTVCYFTEWLYANRFICLLFSFLRMDSLWHQWNKHFQGSSFSCQGDSFWGHDLWLSLRLKYI